MTTFYIVRHGESEANVQQIVQGARIDTPLTEKGKKQAEALAAEFKNTAINAIYSSSALRAKQTAEIIGEILDIPVVTTPQIRERSFGKYEGMPAKEFLAKYSDFRSLTEEEKMNYQLDENEESNISGVKRFISFLEETAEKHPGQTILVISHGGIIRPFMIYVGIGDFDSIGGLDNTGYIKVTADGNSYQVTATKGIKTWAEKHGRL